jgi:hypothetical protein
MEVMRRTHPAELERQSKPVLQDSFIATHLSIPCLYMSYALHRKYFDILGVV